MSTEEIRLDLFSLLPEINAADDRCVEILITELSAVNGIQQLHIEGVGTDSPIFCIHHNPLIIKRGSVVDLTTTAGKKVSSEIGHLNDHVSQLTSDHQRHKAQYYFQTLPGVIEAKVSSSGAIKIEFHKKIISKIELRKYIEELGNDL